MDDTADYLGSSELFGRLSDGGQVRPALADNPFGRCTVENYRIAGPLLSELSELVEYCLLGLFAV